MDIHRKQAKKYFEECSKTEFDYIVTEAMLTPRQCKVAICKKLQAMPTWEIANLLNTSPETITRELTRIYNKIAKIILV